MNRFNGIAAISIMGVMAVAPMMAHAATGSVTYTYDSLGRVTTVTYDNGTTIVYTYDAAGNRTSHVITLP